MDNMIKFYRGLVGNLPETGVNGALYITTDEGAIYYGTGTGMKRLGDFIQVANVAGLPEKAHESCLYYCVAENILAKWNGTEWKQINKQPTAEELKGLLGLGSLAYLSEVGEDNLSSALKEKVNAASEGNHAHLNKDILDTYTQTEADLADAVAKKHAHTFNETELNKIVEGDVAKWNAAEGNAKSYADEKIAALDFTDTAVDGEYVSAVNEVDGKISVTRKALPDYSNTYDAKGAAATAESNAKSYADGLAGNYDAKGTAAGVKTELEGEIAKKVDKVEGKDLIATSEIERLATLHNYDDTQVKADIAKKADIESMTTELGKKVDKVEGYSLVSDVEIARLADVDNYDDTAIRGDIAKKADSETMTTELGKKVDKVEGYSLVSDIEIARLAEVDNYDDGEVRGLIADRYTKEEADGKFAVKGEDVYDDTELAGRVKAIEDDYLKGEHKTALEGLITAEKQRAEGIEGGLRTDVDVIKGDYLKSSDKEELQGQINLIMSNPDTKDVIDSISEFTQYIADHGEIAEGFRKDIDDNAKAISDHITEADGKYETKTDAGNKLTEAKGYTDTEVAKDRERIAVLEAIDHDAYIDADATLKSELQGEIDADVKVVNDALEAYKTSNNAEVDKKANSADVYAKSETYTKSEIEALLTWGEF